MNMLTSFIHRFVSTSLQLAAIVLFSGVAYSAAAQGQEAENTNTASAPTADAPPATAPTPTAAAANASNNPPTPKITFLLQNYPMPLVQGQGSRWSDQAVNRLYVPFKLGDTQNI